MITVKEEAQVKLSQLNLRLHQLSSAANDHELHEAQYKQEIQTLRQQLNRRQDNDPAHFEIF